MAKMRHACLILILVSLLPGLLVPRPAAALVPQDAAGPRARAAAQEIPAGYQPVGESDTFALYASQETLAFKVVDKRSGYVWSSNLDEVAKDDKLNKTWTAFAQSGISLEYMDPKAQSLRQSITNADHTIDFKAIDHGFEAAVTFVKPSITVLVRVVLEGSGVSVEVPFDSIRQADPDFKLALLHVYPFLGATREDSVPGYMFIPDGSGTLIRFSATTKAKNMFYGRYYGADLGMLGTLPWDANTLRAFKISVPVTGMVHGEKQNAFIAVVEKGSAYGEIQAHPAGVTTRFNFLYNAFVYNESYFQPTNRAGAGVTAIQNKTNAFDIKIHYRFLAGNDADYVGMARSYQQYLLDRGDLKKVDDPDADIGIRLEFLGAEKEKVLFWYRTIPMTTVAEVGRIVDGLAVKNAEVVYYGWQPHGASSMAPRRFKLDGKLGSVADLKALADRLAASGGKLYLYYDPQAALYQEPGYSPRSELAMSIANANLLGYNRWHVNYFFNLESVTRRYAALSRAISAQLQAGLALDGISSTLYSDFKPATFLDRDNAAVEYQKLMKALGGSRAFYLPNDYLFGFMDAYYDMPLTSSGYIYTTEAVPFLPIVLAGYVPYYGPALNFSSNLQGDLLKMADYGVYPSYFLTREVTAKILNTLSNWIYSSSYTQWGPDIERAYGWLDALLAPVKGQPIVAREALAADVVGTTYANGKQIIVNYGDTPYTAGDITVAGRDAAIREVQP